MTEANCKPFHKEDLIGTWIYESAYTLFPDGHTSYNFTPTPKGILVILKNGHYSHIVMSPDLPAIASGQLKVMTPEEAMVVATNQLSHFGTWTVDEAAGRFTVHIDWSTFANFDGIDQVRLIDTLNETTLQYENLQTTNGGDAKIIAVLKRVREHD